MIPYFPKQIASKAVYIYLGSLAAVSLLFLHYTMKLEYLVLGTVWVAGFFLLVSVCSKKWQHIPRKQFMLNLFLVSLGLRWLWVVFSYFFYLHQWGTPFEWMAADAESYYWDAVFYYSRLPLSTMWRILFVNTGTISDSGYFFYLGNVARLTGQSIIAPRLINSVFSALTVLLVYLMASRNLGEAGGRLAAVMTCFMPNLIYYCGLHLKETIMVFLMVAFMERADYLIRSRRFNVVSVVLPVLLALSLFSFRTVLGITAVFSLVTAVVLTSANTIGRHKRWVLIVWGVLAVATLWGGTVRSESESAWEMRFENQVAKREAQTQAGNRWAKYATGTVMAPIMFMLPFPTMVDVEQQYNQQVISGGNYVRTFLGGFVLLALYMAIFVRKNWRDLSLVGSFVMVYLAILSASGFSNSERFLLPALPGLLIMAAYGITQLDAKNYRYVRVWYYVVPTVIIGWAVFKLGSRGLL
ncbi:MAG: hypothetical protein IJ760_00855 [Bacteroidales bacterium]|nr:hypothetical protein [Bacteroidales bacterium]